jgi:hypothetical protein
MVGFTYQLYLPHSLQVRCTVDTIWMQYSRHSRIQTQPSKPYIFILYVIRETETKKWDSIYEKDWAFLLTEHIYTPFNSTPFRCSQHISRITYVQTVISRCGQA